jgi:hypothetical protein
MKNSAPFPVLAVLIVTLTAAGCVAPNQYHADPALLQFLQDGQTTKETVMLRLGQPSATLEAERFLTYRLGQDPKHGYFLLERAPAGWFGVKYNLVLVFDPPGILRRHSLVEVH